MRSSETAVVAEEDEVLTFFQHLIGHFARAFFHGHRLFLLDYLSQFPSFPLVLHLRRCPQQHISLRLVLPFAARFEDL